MTTGITRYISPADTAKLVRRALKDAFPRQKFSVRTEVYAGGASVNVRWTDGPRQKAVEAITSQFAGGRFDGMIDLAYNVEHWLRPDGRVLLAHDPGTGGNRGSVPETDNRDLAPVIPDDAELVRFGAKYVPTYRDLSDAAGKIAEAEDWIREQFRIDRGTTPAHDRVGNRWVRDLAHALAYDRAEGESWQEVSDRN